jgi:predicted nucleic acid-binding protein
MPYLADTNVLLRWQRPADPLYAVAQQAVRTLLRRGEQVYVTPQNFVEFWSVATRPQTVRTQHHQATRVDSPRHLSGMRTRMTRPIRFSNPSRPQAPGWPLPLA